MNKKNKIITGIVAVVVIVILIGITIYANVKKSDTKPKASTNVEASKESLVSSVKGIKELYVEKDAKNINWTKDITFDKAIIKEVIADANNVETSKTGEYKLIYKIKGVKVTKEERKEVVVTIVDPTKAQELADSGKTVWITNTELKKGEKKEGDKEKKEADSKTNQSTAKPEAKEKPSAAKDNENKGGGTKTENNTQMNNAGGNSAGTNTGDNTSQTNPQGGGNNSKPSVNDSPNPTPQPSQPEKVWHEPVYEDKWVVDQAAWEETISEPIYETREIAVCNTCGANISGFAGEHLDETMHGGYHSEVQQVQTGTNTYTKLHPEVGHLENVLVKEGYWE